jgi:glutathionyl-hydroquinone reductase
LRARIYATVNNGVYRAGFAPSQEAYEEAFRAPFATLIRLIRAARAGDEALMVLSEKQK